MTSDVAQGSNLGYSSSVIPCEFENIPSSVNTGDLYLVVVGHTDSDFFWYCNGTLMNTGGPVGNSNFFKIYTRVDISNNPTFTIDCYYD